MFLTLLVVTFVVRNREVREAPGPRGGAEG